MEKVEVPRGHEVVRTWRIIDTDNFGGDYPDERFVATGIQYEKTAQEMAEKLNGRDHGQSRFFRVVEHIEIVYRLQTGFQP
jgi:hypothetical protein